jgi:cytochrome c556
MCVTGRLSSATALCCSLLFAWGCHSEAGLHAIGAAHRPALHAVHAERLAAQMHRIEQTYRKAHRLPIRQMQARQFASLEHCAEQIAAYAATLGEAADLSPLAPEDRAVFNRLAGQLERNAEELKSAAAGKDRVASKAAFARLTSTCNGCHAVFRPATHPLTGEDHDENPG